MTSRLTEVIIDCRDLDAMAEFWCAVLGYERGHSGEGWLAIEATDPDGSEAALRARAPAPVVAFVLVPESKAAKNRVHVDVTPFDTTQEAEVERLIALGAARTDIGQSDTPWVVLSDPEGNEFCVMPDLDTP